MIGWSITKQVSSNGVQRRAIRLGIWAAVLIGGPAITRATETVTMAEAGPIRAQCVAAKFSMQTAWAYAAARGDATYWTSYRASQSAVTSAYQLSLAAPWPSSIATTQNKINASLVSIINALSKYSNQNKNYRTSDIRTMLDNQITKLDADAQILQGVVPSDPAPTPDPTPDPAPDPSPTPAPAGTIADLVPGTGFTAATAQPAAIGSGYGADAKAIARWDVVPYQTFAGKLPVGVVAFHMADIDRVEFSVNGGPWTAVSAMTQNPVTGLWEYNVNVDAATLPDGPAEVRAVVYPKVGVPRVLAGPHDATDASLVSGQYSLVLSADQHGTLASATIYVSTTGDDSTGDGTAAKPFATIGKAVAAVGSAANGATIYLAAGDYAYPSVATATATSTPTRWLTVSAAPGLTRDRVRLTSSSGGAGLRAKLVHLKNLTVAGVELNDVSDTAYDRIWTEGCALEGAGPLDATRFFPLTYWTGGIFVTECTIRNVKYPAYGHMLTRNTVIDTIGGDSFREPSGLVANCEVKNLVNRDDTHNDVVQFWDPQPRSGFENIIFYGMKAVQNIDAQALFVQQPGASVHYDNFAFVNYITYATIGAQWQNPGTHLLLWNCDILSPDAALSVNKGGFMFCDLDPRPTSVHDVSVRNCVFQRFNVLQTGAEPSLLDTKWADNNHYVDVASYMALSPGTNATTGGTLASLVTGAVAGDFAPATGSPLLSRCQKLLAPADVTLHARKTPDAIGAVIGAQSQ